MCSVSSSEKVQNIFATGLDHLSFIERLVEDAKSYNGSDRRADRRYTLGVAVRVFPVDESMENLGEGFLAVTRDISLSGAALYYTQPVSERILALEFATSSGKANRTLMEVLRCRPLGPLFEIAGRFVS